LGKFRQGLVPVTTPFRPLLWGLAFIIAFSATTKIQLSDNVLSRAAAMLALTENHQLQLGKWKALTVDWAQTPDGSYFSNKAPGPSLLGVILFYPLYKIGKKLIKALPVEGEEKKTWNDLFLAGILWILSISLQVIPTLWILSRLLLLMKEKGVPSSGIFFFLVAALFANTGAFFLNSFFGHGFAMAASLGVLLFLYRRDFTSAGSWVGLAILGDYSCFFWIPALFVYLLVVTSKDFLKAAFQRAKGGALPMGVLGLYHWLCFGSPLALPQKFQNPSMVWETGQKALWGVITFIPSNYTLWELLVGSRKGILVTQPYILILILGMAVFLGMVFGLGSWRSKKEAVGFSIASLIFFAGIFCMNAGFNAWWGGGTPGPRYLSAAFVPLSFSGALLWNAWPKALRWSLWLGLGVAVLFSLLSLSVGDLPHMEPLWSYMVYHLTETQGFFYRDVKLIVFSLVALWSLFQTRSQTKAF